MLKLLTPRVWSEITAAAASASQPSLAAVAYFGAAGDKLLPLKSGSSLVVDATIKTVSGGGTNPDALRRLLSKGVDIYSAKDLHSKIFAFDKVAFVGSANASTNSQKNLIESLIKFNNSAAINSVRTAISDLCLNRLTDADLKLLSTYYKTPTFKPEPKKQLLFSTLLMELTTEQGKGRETQVQPPIPVWEHYFEVDFSKGSLPKLRLTDEMNPLAGEVMRNIVKHDHNFTIEISGAGKLRPAILQMRKLGTNRYRYKVLRPSDKEFAAASKLFKTVDNPHRNHGRFWHVI